MRDSPSLSQLLSRSRYKKMRSGARVSAAARCRKEMCFIPNPRPTNAAEERRLLVACCPVREGDDGDAPEGVHSEHVRRARDEVVCLHRRQHARRKVPGGDSDVSDPMMKMGPLPVCAAVP